jgi:hypothetical protein
MELFTGKASVVENGSKCLWFQVATMDWHDRTSSGCGMSKYQMGTSLAVIDKAHAMKHRNHLTRSDLWQLAHIMPQQ